MPRTNIFLSLACHQCFLILLDSLRHTLGFGLRRFCSPLPMPPHHPILPEPQRAWSKPGGRGGGVGVWWPWGKPCGYSAQHRELACLWKSLPATYSAPHSKNYAAQVRGHVDGVQEFLTPMILKLKKPSFHLFLCVSVYMCSFFFFF